MAATLIALIWANSAYSDSYVSLWQFKVGFYTDSFELSKPLILWINDGLMAVFFFLIGLEIKREVVIGELNSVKKLAFPLFGALGGMLIPVILFFALNQNPETTSGWGVPMATDIAFSLAILKVLGDRVPLNLKIFLTAFAIVDDIGAVLAIAIFYSSSIKMVLIAAALGILVILYLLSYRGFYSVYVNIIVGVVVWYLFLKAGVHPTLAGILMAFSVPIQQKIYTATFIDNLVQITNNIKAAAVSSDPVLSNEQIKEIDNLESWTEKFQSPLQHLEHKLHSWVAYIIIPIFALANAGVVISGDLQMDVALVRNIVICLVFGNSIGITSVILLAKRFKIIEVPKDISTQHIIGVSFLAGVGFTMSIFIANLAFADSPMYVDSAKIGILIGSLISALTGYFILRTSKPQ